MLGKTIPTLTLLLLLVFLPGPAGARELSIGRPSVVEKCSFPLTETLLREAYRRVGVDVSFVPLPSLLELDFADSGKTDGSLARPESAEIDSRHLVKVPYPLFHSAYVACALRWDVDIRKTADLAKYRVGISRGSSAAKEICRAVGAKPVLLNDLSCGIKMMRAGRLDVIFDERVMISKAAGAAAADVYCSGPLLRRKFYHWLNMRNADLALPLAEALLDMDEDGTSARILGKYAWLLEDRATQEQAGLSVPGEKAGLQ